MVEFEDSKALPEISEEKLREINNFLTNETGVESEEDLKKISREDLTTNNLLSSDQADCLVKHWNTSVRPADNWDVYTCNSCLGASNYSDSSETTSSNSKTDCHEVGQTSQDEVTANKDSGSNCFLL